MGSVIDSILGALFQYSGQDVETRLIVSEARDGVRYFLNFLKSLTDFSKASKTYNFDTYQSPVHVTFRVKTEKVGSLPVPRKRMRMKAMCTGLYVEKLRLFALKIEKYVL